MRFFSKPTKEQQFWSWFVRNTDRLFQFETDQEAIFDDLGAALERVHPGLTFEFGPVREGRREFIVSADGMRELFPAVRTLVAAAPALPGWVIIPFRPPNDITLVIEMGGTALGPSDVWFSAEPDGDRVGLYLFIRGLNETNEELLGRASFILLDNALGEYVVETRVGFIDRQPLPDEPRTLGLHPFEVIRSHFDVTSH
jgi:hypothetical protein